MPSLKVTFALAIGILCLVAGCSDKPAKKPSNVDLKIYVVLKNTDTFGLSNNEGCRFTRADIEAYIARLKAKEGKIFGTNAIHTSLDGQGRLEIIEVTTTAVAQTGTCKMDLATMLDDVIGTQGEWDQDYLNIYFCGYVQLDWGTGQYDLGITLDPRDAAPLASIVINDDWDRWGANTQMKLLDFALEHELGHYLLDLRGQGMYDATEHVPNGTNNLMDENPPHPDFLPMLEKREAKGRIEDGSWTGPGQ